MQLSVALIAAFASLTVVGAFPAVRFEHLIFADSDTHR